MMVIMKKIAIVISMSLFVFSCNLEAEKDNVVPEDVRDSILEFGFKDATDDAATDGDDDPSASSGQSDDDDDDDDDDNDNDDDDNYDDDDDDDCENGGAPDIATSQDELVFENAQVDSSQALNLLIANEGSCNLEIKSIAFEEGTSEEFTCEDCSPDEEKYPIVIPPDKNIIIDITFSPVSHDDNTGAILISSNDPDNPTFRVPISGQPAKAILSVSPPELKFGHVNMGDSATKYLTISNAGSGDAVMTIKSIYTYRSKSDFNNLVLQDPLPIKLAVGSSTVVNVTFRPTAMDTFEDELIIEVDHADNPEGELEDGRIMEITMTGASVTGGNLRVNPNYIDFGMIPADQEVTEVIEICNDGGKNVAPGFYWDSLSDPYFDNLNPHKIGIVPGGGCFYLNVTYIPDPTDPASWGDHRAVLHITADDPETDIPIEMIGSAEDPVVTSALKIEMTYDNNAEGCIGGDFRQVSLIYISQKYGFCDEVDPKPDWLEEGRPRWSKVNNDTNPQYISHASGFDDDLIHIGLFDVLVTYDEDCSSLPVDIYAQLCNISPSTMEAYLSECVIPSCYPSYPPYPPDYPDYPDISNMCQTNGKSTVKVKAYIDNELFAEKDVTLYEKGDDEYVFTFHRTGGQWEMY